MLILLKSIYGRNQTDMQFWKEIVECMKSIHCDSNKDYTCIYFKCTATVLTLCILWIGGCMIWGEKEQVME